MFKYLKIEPASDGLVHVKLARPPANGVDRAMYIELFELFSAPDTHAPGVRVIILSGEGRHFCAGNDLGEFATMTPENGTERMWRVREAFFAIQFCPVPVIGAVHGAALGTGLAIAASCDFIVADRDARLGLPELTVGVMGGARHLARIAPQPLVRRMFLTGEALRAEDMANAGACIVLSDRDDLLATAERFARRTAALSQTAVRLGKRILARIETMDLRTGYEFEQQFTVTMSGHPDSREALAAFADKRDPCYAGFDSSYLIGS